MIIYGLFEYSYDWYEFEEFVAASKKVDKLDKLVTNGWPIVYIEDAHKQFRNSDTFHYYIKQLKVV